MDVTASILSATGTLAPALYRPDGVDLFPSLRGGPAIERTVFWRIVEFFLSSMCPLPV
jgi:hypothetical protein